MRSSATACLVAWILLTSIGFGASAAEKPQIIWQPYSKATVEAQNLTRPILLYFSAKWCPSCLRVERTVFVDKRVVQYVTSNVVAVRVDADAVPELIEKWGVERLPSAVLISADGREQGRIEGYRPAEQYLAALSTLVQNATSTSLVQPQAEVRPAKHAIAPEQLKQQPGLDHQIELATRHTVPSPARVEVLLSMKQEPNLAVDGACLVSMLENRKVVMGNPEFSVEFDGSTYWFAGAGELEVFRAEPTRYIPCHGGLCLVSLIDDGYEIRGSIYYAAIFRRHLYLFAGPEQRKRFQISPKRYCESDLTNGQK